MLEKMQVSTYPHRGGEEARTQTWVAWGPGRTHGQKPGALEGGQRRDNHIPLALATRGHFTLEHFGKTPVEGQGG